MSSAVAGSPSTGRGTIPEHLCISFVNQLLQNRRVVFVQYFAKPAFWRARRDLALFGECPEDGEGTGASLL